MSWEVYATKELWAAYRCSFTPLDDALCQDAYLLPLFDQLWEFGTNGPGASLNTMRETEVYGLLELIVQIAGNGHFLDSVDSLPSGLFLNGNRCMFAPLFKGTLREERSEYLIIPNYRVVDDVVEEPGQPSSMPVVISSGSTRSTLSGYLPSLFKEMLIGYKPVSRGPPDIRQQRLTSNPFGGEGG